MEGNQLDMWDQLTGLKGKKDNLLYLFKYKATKMKLLKYKFLKTIPSGSVRLELINYITRAIKEQTEFAYIREEFASLWHLQGTTDSTSVI